MEERTTGDGNPEENSLSTDEYEVKLPETDEQDEDLIGLSQEEYERKRLERERLIAECEKLILEGERLLKKGDLPSAEILFRQASSYCPDDARAKKGILLAITDHFHTTDPLLVKENALLASSDEATRAFVCKEVGDRLRELHGALKEEADPLRARFEKAQAERRASFTANRNYYFLRFAVLFVFLAGFIIACGVSGYYIARTKESTPLILTIAFGAFAFLTLTLWLFSVRKLLVAQRLCRDNERLSSTEEGARLLALDEKISAIELILET